MIMFFSKIVSEYDKFGEIFLRHLDFHDDKRMTCIA